MEANINRNKTAKAFLFQLFGQRRGQLTNQFGGGYRRSLQRQPYWFEVSAHIGRPQWWQRLGKKGSVYCLEGIAATWAPPERPLPAHNWNKWDPSQ